MLATLDAETIITARGEKERADLRKQAADKEAAEREKEMAKRQARQAAARAKRLAKERQLQAELRQIRSLEIESARINGATQLLKSWICNTKRKSRWQKGTPIKS